MDRVIVNHRNSDIYQEMKHLQHLHIRNRPRPDPVLRRQTLSFLDLPVEVRIMIYRYHLRSEKPFELWFKTFDLRYERSYPDIEGELWTHFVNFKTRLRILRLNRRINREAAEVFYGENEFRFTAVNPFVMLLAFLTTIGTTNTRFLRKLTIHAPFLARDDKHLTEGARYHRHGITNPFNRLGRIGVNLSAFEGSRTEYLHFFKTSFVKSVEKLARLALDRDGGGVALKQLQIVMPSAFRSTSPSMDMEACRCIDVLKRCIDDLAISLVIHHGGFKTRREAHRGDGMELRRLGRYLGRKQWLFKQAVDMGWSLKHVHDFNGNDGEYDVLDHGNIMEEVIPDWTVDKKYDYRGNPVAADGTT